MRKPMKGLKLLQKVKAQNINIKIQKFNKLQQYLKNTRITLITKQ